MNSQTFFGQPMLAQDHFKFDGVDYYLNLDRHERISEWKYQSASGEDAALEAAGNILLGKKLSEAWRLSFAFNGVAHAVYWQLGRLLGYWPNAQNSQLVCRCFGVSLSEIEKSLNTNPQSDTLELRKKSRAGAGCGSCMNELGLCVQKFRDLHRLPASSSARPLGLNPIEFMLQIGKSWQQWSSANQIEASLTLKGVRGYQVYAQWDESADQVVQKFYNELKTVTGCNFILSRP